MDWPDKWQSIQRFRSAVKAGESGFWQRRIWWLHVDSVRRLTSQWLSRHKMNGYSLVVEKRHGRSGLFRLRKLNRFSVARNCGVRMFIEDDASNAARLAQFCDLVLLFAHPYNEVQELPDNVIRVSGWADVLSIAGKLP